MSLLLTRIERAVQLGRDGAWAEIARRVKRKLTPKGEPPEAQEDPVAYARYRHRQRRQWQAPKAAAVTTVYVALPERRFVATFLAALKDAQERNAWLVVAAEGTDLSHDLDAWIAVEAGKGAHFITFDHDELNTDGERVRPFFKPAPSPLRLHFQPYVMPAFALDARGIEAPAQKKTREAFMHALALQHAVRTWHHVPVVLATAVDASADRRLVVKRAPIKKNTHVSILIPFRDQPELLERCLSTLLPRTKGVPFDVLLLDNGSVEEKTRQTLARFKKQTQVLRLDGPFNFSWLNNMGAQRARGTHLLLLNNDTEITDAVWLQEMVALAQRPDVGAVGARLLYPDGTLQHGGVLLGVAGLAAHALSGAPGMTSGHHGGAWVPQEVSAVTGACLLVERRKYFAIGGLDETRFKVAFNDLDFCLRLAARGWRTIYTPDATLIHHESKSRGSRVTVAEDRAFEAAYAPVRDPYLNPNFSRVCPDFRWR